MFKAEYLENGLADFDDFGLISQDFERPFRRNQFVLAVQFSFKAVQNTIKSHFTLMFFVLKFLNLLT